ncbi:MAG TPA: hypothetical protein VFQ61_35230 [Polyangiaceae bacterium]|nr:hypothetical protein [Polyangiaceae bacterium]
MNALNWSRLFAFALAGSSFWIGCAGHEPGGHHGPAQCGSLECAPGEHCELQDVVCKRAPCDPVAQCVPDVEGPFCGGLAGIPCPGSGRCSDDPSDDCDPANGGADCGGVCTCLQTALCIQGLVFDSSPEVCQCVPDPNQDICSRVRCAAGTHCESGVGCVPDEPNPCAAVLCRTGTICEVHEGEAYCVSDGTQECGKTTCGAGSVCCNGSCGICTRPGMACIQIACTD